MTEPPVKRWGGLPEPSDVPLPIYRRHVQQNFKDGIFIGFIFGALFGACMVGFITWVTKK